MLIAKFGESKQDTNGDLVFPVNVFDDSDPATIILTGEERFSPAAIISDTQLTAILEPLADQWKERAKLVGVTKQF